MSCFKNGTCYIIHFYIIHYNNSILRIKDGQHDETKSRVEAIYMYVVLIPNNNSGIPSNLLF